MDKNKMMKMMKMMEECSMMKGSKSKKHKSSGGSHGGSSHGSGGGLTGFSLWPRSLFARPFAVFSLGATVGALVYKKRQEISQMMEPVTREVVRTVAKTSDAGKDFLQEQQEKLSDIIAEVKEEEGQAAREQAAEGEAEEQE